MECQCVSHGLDEDALESVIRLYIPSEANFGCLVARRLRRLAGLRAQTAYGCLALSWEPAVRLAKNLMLFCHEHPRPAEIDNPCLVLNELHLRLNASG